MVKKNITYGAQEYARTKQTLPFRTDVEKFTIVSLVGDVTGKKILDAGCGDGVYARELIRRGAAHVIGVDGAEDFVALAKQTNEGFEGRVEYHHAFIQDFPGTADRDIVVGSYILSYPKDLVEATAYCRAMADRKSVV